MRKINKKKLLFAFLPLLLAVGVLLYGHNAQANWPEEIVGNIIYIFIYVFGKILSIVIQALVWIASYQNFTGSQAVVLGWVIVRDVCNMFFVVVLMIIAFGTILHLENYNYKKWLPKLILMAILINFSKTICGLLIDVAQVVMLTFVNAFKDVAGGNMIDILGIQSIVTMSQNSEDVGFLAVVGAYLLGLVYLIIAVIVVVTMLAMLVMRLVMIWVYVVLSPLAYLLAAFPGAEKYSSEWWSEFVKNLIVGPVLAFFIWLSFAALQTGNYNTQAIDEQANKEISYASSQQGEQVPAMASEASKPGALIKFVIAIGMLIGGLTIAQKIGGAAGSMAGKGMSAIQKGQAMLGGGKSIAKWAGNQLGDLRDIASKKMGVDLNIVAGERRRREQVAYNRELRKAQIRKNTLKQSEEGKSWVGRKAALLSTGDVAWQNIMDKKFSLFRAGSPARSKQFLDKIKEQEAKKKAAEEAAQEIDLKSGNVVTEAEHKANQAKMADLDSQKKKLVANKESLIGADDYKDLIAKEEMGSLTENDVKNLAKKKAAIKKIEETINNNEGEKEVLGRKNDVVADNDAKKSKLAAYQAQKSASSAAISAADAEITKFADVLRKNKLSEVQSARADINAKMESEANKKIANFSNPDQLIGIYKEAEEQHDEGLMAASYKKLTKTGNYNELHKELGIGTGYEGMLAMSKRLQDHGGMTEQDSRALIAEIGELAKSVNHLEAFGAMSMNKGGMWEETGADNQQAAILAEKSKIQVQQFVRSVNRLGAGSYQNGQPHDADHWELSASTISLFASKDKSYAGELEKTGNINVIRFIGANPKNLEALEKNGAKEVAKTIREVCAKGGKSSDVSNPLKAVQSIVK